jgi:integrase
MPRLTHRLPAYRKHKASGQAIVSLSGKIHYLGPYGSPESKAEYDRLTGGWLTRGRSQPETKAEPGKPETTVAELVLAFWTHSKTHYRSADGKPTQERQNVKDALKPLKRLYGDTLARDFGPLALRSLRDHMVRSGRLSRTTINQRINRVRRAFKWAASVEMIPAAVHEALRTVEGLQIGRTDALEAEPVESVPREIVEATLPHLPRPVAAMVQLQLLTGMRAGEVMAMRGCELHPGSPLWEYRPAAHKNAWRGKTRVVPLGPRAAEIVREFLKADTQAYLFDPRSVVHPGFARLAGERYDRRGYRQAVVRACDRAFPHPTVVELQAAIKTAPKGKRREAMAALRKWKAEHRDELRKWRDDHRWSPLQLRHTVATEIESTRGREAASSFLGHAKLDTTQIYVDRDLAKARAIAQEIG